jgi:intracellular sulfur oxidation DsrE/DsrF family protein
VFGQRPSAVGTLVERHSRYGREMAEHLQITIDSGVQVYFCEESLAARHQREHNGLLRQ